MPKKWCSKLQLTKSWLVIPRWAVGYTTRSVFDKTGTSADLGRGQPEDILRDVQRFQLCCVAHFQPLLGLSNHNDEALTYWLGINSHLEALQTMNGQGSVFIPAN